MVIISSSELSPPLLTFLDSSSIPIDFVIHPRDLNLAFVAYGGSSPDSEILR